MRYMIRPLLLFSLVVLASCGSDSPSAPQTGTVVIEVRETTFSPSEVTIAPGTTVRWVNQGNVEHTVTPDGHSEWARAVLTETDEVFEHTFDNPGTFAYLCEPHQAVGMVGTIQVVEP